MSKDIEQILTALEQNLPLGWSLATIEDLVGSEGVFVDGDWVESKDQDPNGDVRLIQLADIGDGVYRNKSERFLTHEKALELGCTFLQKEDVLIARMPDPLGRACVFPGDRKKAVTVVDVAIARAGNGEFNHRWLMYFINAPAFRSSVASLQSGSTRKRISRGNLARIALPVPPRPHQDRIVAEIEKQFSRLDEAVASLKRTKANLKRYKAAVLKAAVEGKLTEDWRKQHPDVEPASKLLERILAESSANSSDWTGRTNLPPTWCWTRIEDIGDVQLGRQRAPRYHSGPNMRPYLRVQNVFEDRIDLEDVMEMDFPPADFEKFRLSPGDILLNEGQSPELLGRPAIYRGELPDACFTNTLIRFRVNALMTPRYPFLVFRAYMRNRRFTKEGTITTNIAHLSAGRFAKIEFPLPPLAEQEQIVAEVERRLSVIDELESTVLANLTRADRLRQAILAQAFSGRVVSHEADHMPNNMAALPLAAESRATYGTNAHAKSKHT